MVMICGGVFPVSYKPEFIVLFGGRKSEDFAENPLPRISMFTSLVGLWSYFPTNQRLSN
jgi:hypothetical protein